MPLAQQGIEDDEELEVDATEVGHTWITSAIDDPV